MSIASLGIIGGLAGTQLPQRAADADKVQQTQGEQSRQADAAEKAEAAAGIGTTEEDAETSDRDADGRRLWERSPSPQKVPDPSAKPDLPSESRPKDPSGACGVQLDLLG
jgi:hypothetical protein